MARSPDAIRNVAVIGHGTSGKTTLVESLLLAGGAVSRAGKVEEGSTVCDFDREEKERKHSIDLACCFLETQAVLVQLIDTPGYRDFIGQVYCALTAADCALLVVSADEGVRPNTRKVWEIARDRQLPCLVVINRLDREHADFDRVLAQMRSELDSKCVALTVPDRSGPAFSRVETSLSEELRESVVETDETLMERYLADEEVSDDEIHRQLGEAVATRKLFPVLATSAEKHLGVAELLEAIVQYAPPASRDLGREAHTPENPEEAFPVETSLDEPFCAQVFRVVSDPYVGKLTCLRLFSGSLAQNGTFVHPVTGKSEKIGKISRLQGKEQHPVESASAGQIVALLKVESLQTFQAVSSERKIVIPPPSLPTPMCSVAVEPKTQADEKKFAEAFMKLVEDDVTLRAERDRRTNELVVSGMSTLHLQILWERLKTRFGVDVRTKPPKTPYQETISTLGDDHYRHKKQTGGAGEFAEVWLRVEPKERGTGVEFVNEVFGGAISAAYVQSAEKGIRQVLEQGVVAGCPVVDVKVTIYDGKEHPVDSKDVAFQRAGREAFKLAIQKAKPVLLEPIVNMEVTFPSEAMGEIQGDLTRRRGRVQGVDSVGDFQVLRAQVPLAEITDYASSLGSITGGQGTYAVEMSHYEVVPPNIQQKVIEQYQKERKEG